MSPQDRSLARGPGDGRFSPLPREFPLSVPDQVFVIFSQDARRIFSSTPLPAFFAMHGASVSLSACFLPLSSPLGNGAVGFRLHLGSASFWFPAPELSGPGSDSSLWAAPPTSTLFFFQPVAFVHRSPFFGKEPPRSFSPFLGGVRVWSGSPFLGARFVHVGDCSFLFLFRCCGSFFLLFFVFFVFFFFFFSNSIRLSFGTC